MSVPRHPQLGLQEITNALGMLQHLQDKIEGVWLDYFADEPRLLPLEVAQVHLQRETEALAQQVEKAVILAFGEDSLPLHQVRAIGFLPPSPRSVMDLQLLLDSFICDLQHKRLDLFRSSASSPRSAPVRDDF